MESNKESGSSFQIGGLPGNRNSRIQVIKFGGSQGNLLVLLSVCSLNLQLHQLLLNPLYGFLLTFHSPANRKQAGTINCFLVHYFAMETKISAEKKLAERQTAKYSI